MSTYHASPYLLLCCFFSSAVLLLNISQPWLLALGGLLALWHMQRITCGSPLCPFWCKCVLSLIAGTLTFSESYDSPSLILLINFVLLGYSLKLLELRSARDFRAFALSGIALVGLALLSHENAYMGAFAIAAFVLHLLLLLGLDAPIKVNLLKRFTFWQLLALPCALLVVAVLPRLAPFWASGENTMAQSGLANELQLANVGPLFRSNALAFQAQFNTSISASPWYWRALVLNEFDGERWRVGQLPSTNEAVSLPSSNDLAQPYRIYYHDAQTPWAASLWPSVFLSSTLAASTSATWQTTNGDKLKGGYAALKLTRPMPASLSTSQQAYLKQLPKRIDARVHALANEFLAQDDSLSAMARWFRNQAFVYTLNPPRYAASDMLGGFLFEQQQGFCVHYAQAVTVLSRLMGYPSRIVMGYLGGELSDDKRLISVFDFDAHAWVEIWNGQEWLQLDPTQWIAPERINQDWAQNPLLQAQWQEATWLGQWWQSDSAKVLRQHVNYWRFRWAHYRHIWGLWIASQSLLHLVSFSLLVLLLGLTWRLRRIDVRLYYLKAVLLYWHWRGFTRDKGENLPNFLRRIEQKKGKAPALNKALYQYYRQRYLP